MSVSLGEGQRWRAFASHSERDSTSSTRAWERARSTSRSDMSRTFRPFTWRNTKESGARKRHA
jgi:hypothetical protein